jgi:hypothetical protein
MIGGVIGPQCEGFFPSCRFDTEASHRRPPGRGALMTTSDSARSALNVSCHGGPLK